MLKRIFKETYLLDPKNSEYYQEDKSTGLFEFRTVSKTEIAAYPLKGVVYNAKLSYDSVHYWKGSLDEYQAVYNSEFNRFINKELKNVYELLRKDGNKMQYTTELNKFDLTVLTALNTITESKEYNDGEIIPEVKENVLYLLNEFVQAIQTVEVKRFEYKELMRKATNDGLVKILKDEVEYVDKFASSAYK